MKIFLTGGTGFLGGRILDLLLAEGHEVNALARRPEALDGARPGLRIVAGDLSDENVLRRGVEGVDAVIHTAAVVKRWVRDPSVFERVNVDAFSRLVDLSLAAGASRFLYCSSFIALGPTDMTTGDESTLHDGQIRNDYERTKLLAEREARRRQAEGEPLIVLYPGVVYGPGRLTDGNILAALSIDLLRGRLPGTVGPGDRRQCLAYVDDVARGFLLALERAEPGSRYVLGGENLTVAEVLRILAAEGGVERPRRVIPYALASWVGRLLRWQAAVTGVEPKLTDGEVEIYRHEWAYSSRLAEEQLGYRITPAREGLGRMIRWLIEEGHAPAGPGRPAGRAD